MYEDENLTHEQKEKLKTTGLAELVILICTAVLLFGTFLMYHHYIDEDIFFYLTVIPFS